MRQYLLTLIIFIIPAWQNSFSTARQDPAPRFDSSSIGGLYFQDNSMSLLQLSEKIEELEQRIIEIDFDNSTLQLERRLVYTEKLKRYQNGIDIIKLLYEKLLDLDHHFTTINTFNDIHEITNLNNYPEFIEVRENLINDSKQKSSIELPQFLQQNIFVTVGYTLLSSVFGEGNPSDRHKSISEIACLLDFTVSMQSDLKMIYYETEFLHQATKGLLERCKILFTEYTSILDYHKSIFWCREKDDWELLDKKIDDLKPNNYQGIRLNPDPGHRDKQVQLSNDIEFQITRLIGLMESYDNFINQGVNYYSKFKTILDNYENEESCVGQLPEEIRKLKEKVNLSIEKYTTAYNLVELQGSGLKNLLFTDE